MNTVDREPGRPKNLPRVSAVIVNRNGAEHLRVCLPSLRAQSYGDIEIVVVDNASSDESATVAEHFGTKWLALEQNVGLAPALNKGAAAAMGKFLLFVNNDMRFDSQFVERLAQRLSDDPSIFAVDGMQFNWDGTAPGHLATRLGARKGSRLCLEIVPGLFLQQFQTERSVPAFMASAASMMVRRYFFEKLGGFDERLPLSYEDVDICWRAWLHGWKTIYVPGAVCWHRVGASSRSPEGSLLLFRGVLTGRLFLATRLLPLRYFVSTWVASILGLTKDLFSGKWKLAMARCQTLVQSALRLPRWLTEKRAIYAATGKTASQQLKIFLELDATETQSVAEAAFTSGTAAQATK
jgi:GT2 family glycosyltransferase